MTSILESSCTINNNYGTGLYYINSSNPPRNFFQSIYGMTELTAGAFQSLPIEEDEYKVTNTVGYIGDHLEAKVVDSNNNMVPLGTPGELCIRGYTKMLGYWNDEEQTKKMIGEDGWIRTG